MREEIKVHVIDYGRKSLYMRYVDPVTGKQVTKTTGTKKRKEAIKIAAKWEHDLREGRYKSASKLSWDEFWDRYEKEALSGLAKATIRKAMVVKSVAERFRKPSRIVDVNAEWLSGFQTDLRSRDIAESTIDGYLGYLRPALQWAVDQKILPAVPKVKRPKRKRGATAKGRSIVTEEFERLLGSVSAVVGTEAAPSWKHYLLGLWWSGLRLAESLQLFWDRDDRLCVDLSGRRPMLWIPAEHEKGYRDRIHPISPEFAEFLLATPEHERTGQVFKLDRRGVHTGRLSTGRVGEIVSEIGEKARVKVWTHPKTGKVKYASAHDLRRSFGFRWALRVMPAVLQQMMRHESITTSMKYYVGRDAEATADAIWGAYEGGSPAPLSEGLKSNRHDGGLITVGQFVK